MPWVHGKWVTFKGMTGRQIYGKNYGNQGVLKGYRQHKSGKMFWGGFTKRGNLINTIPLNYRNAKQARLNKAAALKVKYAPAWTKKAARLAKAAELKRKILINVRKTKNEGIRKKMAPTWELKRIVNEGISEWFKTL